MKKYVKPELFYERYELTQHIADCAWEMQYANENACTALGDAGKGMSGLGNLFVSTNSNCGLNETNYQAYCYTNGTNQMNVFIS